MASVVIIRLLTLTEPEDDNSYFLKTYRHQRLMQVLWDAAFAHCVEVQTEALFRPSVIVLDTYVIKMSFWLSQKFSDVIDDDEAQSEIRFLRVNGFSS